jgi:hypothetical protein
MLRLYVESLIFFRKYLLPQLLVSDSTPRRVSIAQNLYFWGMSGGVMRSLARSAIG